MKTTQEIEMFCNETFSAYPYWPHWVEGLLNPDTTCYINVYGAPEGYNRWFGSTHRSRYKALSGVAFSINPLYRIVVRMK